MSVWLDGALREDANAVLGVRDRGLTLGDGLFETLRFSHGAIWRLGRHLARLRRSAALLALPLPYDDAAIAAALAVLIRGHAAAALRITLTAGVGPRGLARPTPLAPSLLITLDPLPAATGPLRLVVARSVRRNARSPLSRIKALGYGDALWAHREARARGADDAILLNGAGELACATAATLLLRDRGCWSTPPEASGALGGISRAVLIARGLVIPRVLRRRDLAHAEQALLVNALGVREVACIEGRALTPCAERILPILDALADPEIGLTLF